MMSTRKVYSKLVGSCRGLLNPITVPLTARRNYDLRETLVISGFPRSGTTWLAEVAATIPGTAILFEPDNFSTIRAARDAGLDRNNFHLPGDSWPSGEAYLERVLSGRVIDRWTTADIPITRAIGVNRWIVKFVRANQMVLWLADRFSIPPPVLLVRHPCAVLASWTSRGWPMLQQPEPNPRFIAQYPKFETVLSELTTAEEYFAARWCMSHYSALTAREARSFQLVFYERLMRDGVREVDGIFRRWGVRTPPETKEALERPSAKASHRLSANVDEMLSGWQRQLESRSVDRVLGVLARFGLDFYGRSEEPDYSHPLLGRGLDAKADRGQERTAPSDV